MFFRRECDSVATSLKKAGIQAESYHAGLTDRERVNVQDRWVAAEFCKVSGLTRTTIF